MLGSEKSRKLPGAGATRYKDPVHSHVLFVPTRRPSGWVTETDPQYARAWLESLPLADSAETGREIYHAVYTLNRLEADVSARFELMELYGPVVASVCAGLQSYLAHQVPPLGPKKRQLAEFLRRLHVEMAYGYKLCLHNLGKARFRVGRRARLVRSAERALFHLGEVLLRSYVVYMPYPGGTWREIHELYRLAEAAGFSEERVPEASADATEASSSATIRSQYLRVLLLGVANPYQLSLGMAQQVQAFLARWGDTAVLSTELSVPNPAAHFLVELDADGPPQPFPRRIEPGRDPASLRTLNVFTLVRTLRGFVDRIEKGGAIDRNDLGVDWLETSCLDFLRRLVRLWGLSARRRHARRQQRHSVLVCSGIDALHFFVNGQQPFDLSVVERMASADADFIELDQLRDRSNGVEEDEPGPGRSEHHRVDRWQVRDVGPHGMALARYGDAQIGVRVGDLLGFQEPNDLGRWRAAVVRWMKSPESGSIELGVEFLCLSATPVAVRRLHTDGRGDTPYRAGLRLEADPRLRRPATLLVARGLLAERRDLELVDSDGAVRRVRPMRLLERTGAFEQFVYADVAR